MKDKVRQFKGIVPAVVTPFTPTGDVNVEVFRRIVEFDIQGGALGLWVCGGTGESVLLEDDERIRLAEAAVDQAHGRAKVIFHVGALTTARAARLAKRGRNIGVDAICSVTPFFYGPSPQAIVDHYKAVADAAGLPFFVYNLPESTGVEVTPAIMARIVREVPQTAGIKHSGPELFPIRAFADLGVATFTGHSGLLLSALVMDAVGCIDGPACVAPELYVKVYNAYQMGDIAGAQKAMKKAAALTAICYSPAFIAICKTVLETRLNIDCGPPRAPLPVLTESEKARVLQRVRRMGLVGADRSQD